MNTNNIPFKEVEFEIEKEVWNRYELSDNAELRIRGVIIKILKGPDAPDPVQTPFTGEIKNLTNIVPMQGYALFGQKTNKTYSVEELQRARKVPVNFNTLVEDWNTYRLTDGSRIKTKLVVTQVQRLEGIFDAHGIPVYNVESTNIVTRTK